MMHNKSAHCGRTCQLSLWSEKPEFVQDSPGLGAPPSSPNQDLDWLDTDLALPTKYPGKVGTAENKR